MNGKRNRGANTISVINEYRGEVQCTFFFLFFNSRHSTYYVTGYEQSVPIIPSWISQY